MNAQTIIRCVRVYNKRNSFHWCACTLHAKFAYRQKKCSLNSTKNQIVDFTFERRLSLCPGYIKRKPPILMITNMKLWACTNLKCCNCAQLIDLLYVCSLFIGCKIAIAHSVLISEKVQRNETKWAKNHFYWILCYLTFATWAFSASVCACLLSFKIWTRMCHACNTFIALNHISERPTKKKQLNWLCATNVRLIFTLVPPLAL